MATALSLTFTNKDFKNWLKGALAVLFAKEGITDFVSSEISICHNSLLQLVPTANVLKSCSCTINSLPKCVSHRQHQHSITTSGNTQLCSRGVCHILMDGICQNHRYRGPAWKNTDPQKWCTDPYEIAKCYMPPDGYANKSSMAETDFNGTVAVIINNKYFQKKFQAVLATEPNICTKARDVGRAIRHTADHLLSDSDLHRYIDDLINLLCDPGYLVNDPTAQVAVVKLKQLKANTLNISEHDITELLNENIKETFSELQQQYLQAIQKHFSQLQTDSIVEIDRLVSIKKRELEEITGKKKEEITKQVEAHTQDFYVKKSELEEFSSKKQEEINKQVEAQTQDFSVKKTELEEFSSKKKEEITKQVEAQAHDFSVKKTELEEFTCKKKEEITKHVEDQTQDFSVKKTELEEFTSKKKEEITKHVEAQTHDFSVKKTELEEFKSKQMEDITRLVDKKTQEIETRVLYHRENQGKSDRDKQKALTDDLITYYRKNESTMPFYPLVEEHDVQLMDFYVRPPISFMEKTHIFKSSKTNEQSSFHQEEEIEHYSQTFNNNEPDKTEVILYRDLFFKENCEPFENIYVTADAGMGKTALSQHITMHWCQSHKPDVIPCDKYKHDDIETMKHFKFVFLLHLRDVNGSQTCDLDDLIYDLCIKELSRKSLYSKEFLESILHHQRCLVILDGLDEWAHPSKCRKTPKVPHHNHPHTCTVLTTTRPWKLCTIVLSSTHIDRHAVIGELDYERSEELEQNAFEILRRIPSATAKCIEDFNTAVALVGDICNNPYIKLHLMCLWYEGDTIGKSRCEIYSNITELTLKRGLKKRDLPSIKALQAGVTHALPKCFEKNNKSTKYIDLLVKLGKLAFFSLFSEVKESMLIINGETATKYLKNREQQFCLKVGLLCQIKEVNQIVKTSHKVYFQHKSIQEFFSALYIQWDWGNTLVLSTILKVCKSLPDILEMSEVFVFVCGLNPEAYSDLFKHIQAVIERDQITCSYRTLVRSGQEHIIHAYQSMQVSCIKENLKNNNGDCLISVQDIVLDEFMSVLCLMLKSTSGQIKSCCISDSWVTLKDIMTTKNLLQNRTYQNTTAEHANDDCTIENAISLFEQNIAATVQTLRIHSISIQNLRSSSVSTFLSGSVRVLKYLSIYNLTVSADDLELLYAFLGKINLLTCFNMERISVKDSRYSNSDNKRSIVLDLSLHSQLQTLYINQIPNPDLLLKAEMIQYCELQEFSLIHHNIYKLIASIGSGKWLDKLTLHKMKCLDHSYNCPGVPLKMCQGSQIRTLDLQCLNLDVLDLSQSHHLQKINLLNISLNEIRINTERLEICKLKLRNSLPLTCIKQIFSSIESGKMLEELSLSTELYLDHPISCPGVKLNLSKHCNLQRLFLSHIQVHNLELAESNTLQQLSLLSVPINNIDLFRSNYLQKIDLRDVPLRELTVNNECLEYCTVQSELLLLSHDTINKLANFIGSGTMLKQLTLKQIQCMDHFQSCPGVPLTFCNNSKIQQIYLCSVPISVLGLVESRQVNTIMLKNIPLCEFHTNTEYFNLCRFEAELSRKLPHTIIDQLLRSIGSCKMLSHLTLNQIQCSEHDDSCPGVPLTFCKNSQIQQLNVSRVSLDVLDLSQACQVEKILLQNTSLRELHTSTKFLKECTLEAEFSVELPHAIIHKFLSSLGNCMALKYITLKQIKCLEHSNCAGSPLIFCSNSELRQLIVFRIPISELDLSKSNQLQKIILQNVTLCELKISTECVNLCTLESELSVELSHTAICQLLCSIGSSLKLSYIKLSQIHCLDHPNSCPGVPLSFCNDCQLQQLFVDRVPLSVLDLSQTVRVTMIELRNLPLCELHTSTKCLQSCKLHAELSTELPHASIQQLLCSIGGCKMLRDITLTQIKCSDHLDNCPGTKMTFCKDSQLQLLFVDTVPLSVLDLSRTGQVKTIGLFNIPLCELQTSADVLQTCILHARTFVNLSHNNLQQLFTSIKGCEALTEINLQGIKCSDHPKNCSGVPLTFCENSQLQQITMCDVPLSVLDLSKTSHVKTISLQEIPLRQFHSNTKWLNSCTLETESLVALQHTSIEELLCSLGNCMMLSNITLNHIRCLDHHDSCPGVPLTFCKNSKLQKLTLISVPLSVLDLSQTGQVNTIQLKRMPLRALHTVSDCLQLCILEADLSYSLSHNIIQELFCSFGDCMTLKNLTIEDIKCSEHADGCLGVPLTFCKNSQLQQLTVRHVPLSVLDLAQAGQVRTIKMLNIPLCELKTSAECLHSCILEADSLAKLSHNSIHYLFSSIGKCITLSDITLKQIQCSDHPVSCSNVPLLFCQNSQLQHLNLFKIPISVLDISQSDQVETIKLENIPLCEIRMNTECLQLCKLDAVLSATLSHNKIEQILCSTGSCKMLTHITLKDIKCTDHQYSCPGVPLIFVTSSKLVSLSLCSVPVSVLDLSQTIVNKILLQNIPLRELHTNNACLNSCTLTADLSVKVAHNTIQNLLRSIGSCVMLTDITMKKIECSDHLDRCPGVDLIFVKNSELKWLTLDSVPVSVLNLSQAVKVEKLHLQNIPLCELNTNTEYVNACTIKADIQPIMLSQSNIHQFTSSIGQGKMLEELTIHKKMILNQIQIKSDVPLKMCQYSQLRKLSLSCLAFSALDLSQTSHIEKIKLSSTYFHELYFNTDHLQMFALENTELPHKCIQQVFSTIESANILQQLTVSYIRCLDHRDCCQGVEINLSRNYDLQMLTLSDVPISALDLPKSNHLCNFLLNVPYNNTDMFQSSYLQEDVFRDDPLRRLNINNGSIRKCYLVALSHNSIFKLLTAIGSCELLEVLALKQIFCSDHLESCPGVELQFSQESNLKKLTVYSVPISVLDLSQATRQMTLTLQNISLCELHINSECLNFAVLSVQLPHATIQYLLVSVRSSLMLENLTLAKIQCSDHPKSCPGFPMSFQQDCKLTHLTICRVPISVLDLSQAGEVNTIRLKNIPLCEIRANNGCLKLSKLEADLPIKLPHNFIEKLLSFAEKCVMLSDITLKNIKCLDHIESCFDFPMTFCKYTQPQQINLDEDLFVDFNFSQSNQEKNIKLQNLPLCAINTFIESHQPCTLEVELSDKLPHAKVQKLFSFIGSCTMLSAITLKRIQCLDHLDNCPGVPLIFCKNSNLQQLFAIEVPIRALDLSNVSHVKPIQPLNIPPRYLRMNTECDEPFTLELYLSDKLPHIDIQKLLSSIGSCIMFRNVRLKHIECLDHPENCPGVPLNFCKNSNLQQLLVIDVPISSLDLSQIDQVETIQLQNIALSELHTNTECLQPCTLEAESVKLLHSIMQKLFNSIGNCINIKELNLRQIQCLDHTCSCPGVPLKFGHNSILHHLSLTLVPLCLLDFSHFGKLQDLRLENIPPNEIDLSKACNLKRLYFHNVKLPLSAWRVLVLSFRNLPLLNEVYFDMITMSASQWKELLTLMFTGTLAHNISLSVSCAEPSSEEWENIASELKALSVSAEFGYDKYLFNKNIKSTENHEVFFCY